MLIVAVTGGIASGKSTITKYLRVLGAPTISADSIARDLLAPGTSASKAVLAQFPKVRNLGNRDAVDRAALAAIVFSDPEARKKLESILHPPVISHMQLVIDAWRKEPGKAGVAEIPLLFEAGLRDMVDKVVVATCRRSTQMERLRERLELSDEEAAARIDSQWPLEQKAALADFVIDTDAGAVETQAILRAFWDSLPVTEPPPPL